MSPQFLHHNHTEKLRCPYEGCRKSFDKPTVLTDSSTLPRTSYYVCPHCMSKLDIVTDDLKIVDIKAKEYGIVFDSPAKCAHYSGLLSAISRDVTVPDDCLVCPKILQCGPRRRQSDL